MKTSRGWRDASMARACAALTEGLSSIPSNHIWQLKTACNPSSREPNASDLCRHLYSDAHTHPPSKRHMQTIYKLIKMNHGRRKGREGGKERKREEGKGGREGGMEGRKEGGKDEGRGSWALLRHSFGCVSLVFQRGLCQLLG